MPYVHLYGYTKPEAAEVKETIRQLLIGAEYAEKLTFVTIWSETEGVVDKKPAPYVHLQGRAQALEPIWFDFFDRLTGRFEATSAHNQKWLSLDGTIK